MAAGYVKKILKPAKILSVLQSMPIYCDDLAGNLLTKKTVMSAGVEVFDTTAAGVNQDYLHMASGSRISWFDLRPEQQNSGKTWLKMHLEGQMTSNVHQSGNAAKQLRPMFYLPYKQNCTTRMKLSPDPNHVGDEVRFFATATINGCSVYIEGNPDTPKVTHANAGSFGTTHKASDSWATIGLRTQGKSNFMDQRYTNLNKTPGHTSLVERSNYMAASALGVTEARTTFARVMGVGVNDVYEDTYNPLGALVGLKQANGHWKFWVQRNVLFGYKPRSGGYKSGYIVLGVSEVWPNGGGNFRQV